MRTLIINLDDFGMHHVINEGIERILAQGHIRSVSLLSPGLYFDDAIERLRRLGMDTVGVHLTLTSEYDALPMTPLTSGKSFTKANGSFVSRTQDLPSRCALTEAEDELWAQVEKITAHGLKISHIDGHMFFYEPREIGTHVLLDIVRKIGRKLKVPVRCRDSAPDTVRANSYFIWVEAPTPEKRAKYYTGLPRQLEEGLSELIIHPAIEDPALHHFTRSGPLRTSDYTFFSDDKWIEGFRKEGISLSNWSVHSLL